MPGLHALMLFAILVAPVIIAVVLYRRFADRAASLSGRIERAIVSLVAGGAVIAIPVSLYAIIANGVTLATATSVRVHGIPLANAAYPSFLRASDAPVDAGYESAWVDVANLPGYIRTLLWVEGALPSVIALVIAVGVAWLALALLRGDPFARAFPAVLGVVAIVIIVAGLAAPFIGGVARSETVMFLGPPELMTAHDDGSGPTEGFVGFMFTLDFAPVAWGMGIALVSAAFSIGTRMRHDVRGLV